MNIVIGRGNNRMEIKDVATGREMRALAKSDPIEHTKRLGNLKALVRRQPTVHVKGKIAKELAQ